MAPLCLRGHMSMKSELLPGWTLDFLLRRTYIPVSLLIHEKINKLLFLQYGELSVMMNY